MVPRHMAPTPSITSPDAAAAARALYEVMVLLRAVGARLVDLQRDGELPHYAAGLGEEGAIAGAALALDAPDWFFGTARDSGAAVARGMSLDAYFAQVFGRASDPAMGRQAPGHVSSKAARFASVAGVPGAHLLHAVGLGWASRTQRAENVALAMFGDGATASEGFHNALNFAGVFRASTVLVCRNSGGAAARGEAPTETVAERAVAYGLASARVDGADALAVVAAVRAAASRARLGEGATLLEVTTTRWDGDAARCPVARLRAALAAAGAWTDADEAELSRSTQSRIDAPLAAARSAPGPDPRSMFDFVYATVPPHLERDIPLLDPTFGPK